MEILVSDYKGRHYKVETIESKNQGRPCLLCFVYRGLGIGANPYDYGEMEYEDDFSSEFTLYPMDWDDIAIEEYIEELFDNEEWVEENIVND